MTTALYPFDCDYKWRITPARDSDRGVLFSVMCIAVTTLLPFLVQANVEQTALIIPVGYVAFIAGYGKNTWVMNLWLSILFILVSAAAFSVWLIGNLKGGPHAQIYPLYAFSAACLVAIYVCFRICQRIGDWIDLEAYERLHGPWPEADPLPVR